MSLPLARALIWLRWRSLVNLLRFSRRRRGVGAAVAAWGGAAIRVALSAVALLMATALAVGAGFAVWALAGGGDGGGRDTALLALRLAVGALTLVVVLFAVLGGARSGGDTPRLLLLPVAPRQLHALELVAVFAEPALLVATPALAVLGLGTALLHPAAGLPALLASALLLAVLAALASVASFAVQLLVRDRRRAERAAVIAIVVWLAISALPPALAPRHTPPAADGAPAASPAAVQAPGPSGVERAPAGGPGEGGRLDPAAESFPIWLQPLPSESFALALAGASAAEQGRAWRGAGALALALLACYGLSVVLWRRLIASPESGSGRRGGAAAPLPALRPPGLSAAAVAVAWAHVRGAWRTVQGKLALVVPALTLLVVAGSLRQVDFGSRLPVAPEWGGATLAIAGVGIALLSQQTMVLNQFAVDGAGLTLELVAPLSDRDLLVGKAAGGAVLTAAALLPTLLVIATLQGGPSPLMWPAALLAGLGAYALMVPVAAWLSILLPKAVDLSRLGQNGKPHGGAAMIGFAALPATLAPPLALGALALAGWGSPMLLLVVEAIWLAAAAAAAAFFLRHTEGLLARRREAILLVVHDRG